MLEKGIATGGETCVCVDVAGTTARLLGVGIFMIVVLWVTMTSRVVNAYGTANVLETRPCRVSYLFQSFRVVSRAGLEERQRIHSMEVIDSTIRTGRIILALRGFLVQNRVQSPGHAVLTKTAIQRSPS